MESWVLVSPVLPGKLEEWRRFCQALLGSRRAQYEESRRRLGITRELAWLADTPAGGLAVVYVEAEAPDRLLAGLAGSHLPFDRWFRQQLKELSGLDLSETRSLPLQERIFQWETTELE